MRSLPVFRAFPVIAALLVLSACGSSGDDALSTSVPDAATTTQHGGDDEAMSEDSPEDPSDDGAPGDDAAEDDGAEDDGSEADDGATGDDAGDDDAAEDGTGEDGTGEDGGEADDGAETDTDGGDDSDPDNTTPDTTSPPDDTGTDDDGIDGDNVDGGNVDGDGGDTTDPSDDGGGDPTDTVRPPPPVDDLPVFSGDPDSEYCMLGEQASALDDTYPNSFADPVETEAYFTELLPLYEKALAVAPDEIADDFVVQFASFQRLTEALEEVDWVTEDAADVLTDILADPLFDNAITRLEAYDTQVCDA